MVKNVIAVVSSFLHGNLQYCKKNTPLHFILSAGTLGLVSVMLFFIAIALFGKSYILFHSPICSARKD